MVSNLSMRLGRQKFISLQVGLLSVVAFALRMSELGYSDLQGDETKALCRISDFDSMSQFAKFLLGQRKGPIQFLVTCASGALDPTFSSELALRLPFAIANLAAVACFFMLVYRLFNINAAIYSSFLLATNGIFVAFGRIVQYQSFAILGGVAGILGLLMAVQDARWRVSGLYIGFTAAAIGLLAHFDGVFALPPMVLLVYQWLKRVRDLPEFARLRMHLMYSAGLFAILVLGFYVEYAFRLAPYQIEYWRARLEGNPTDTLRLFQFYNPGPIAGIYLASICLGLTRIRKSIAWQVVVAWLLPPLYFMEVLFKDSRTHTYTYLLPLLILAGLGFEAIVAWLHRQIPGGMVRIAQGVILGVFAYLSYSSYAILVDHHPEYPWHPKQVLNLRLAGGSLTGTFGFPYAREWREIAGWFASLPRPEITLATNEKTDIASFYLPSTVQYKYSSRRFPSDVEVVDGIYILIVQNPQSWMDELWGVPVSSWRDEFIPIRDFVNDEGRTVASVYFFSEEQIEAAFR